MYLIQFIETVSEIATEPRVDDISWQGMFESLDTMSENLQDWILNWLKNTEVQVKSNKYVVHLQDIPVLP
jgi:hypothetical protein